MSVGSSTDNEIKLQMQQMLTVEFFIIERDVIGFTKVSFYLIPKILPIPDGSAFRPQSSLEVVSSQNGRTAWSYQK